MSWLLVAAVTLSPDPARASWMTLPPPWTAKDFTMVKRDGVYHLFFIRNNLSVPFEETQKDFGHATSEDLYIWTQQPPVLEVRPGFFDNSHVWAPSIVERDGVYYLFYTGVRDSLGFSSLDQTVGIATSTDLDQWNRMDLPVFDCAQVPWAWCDSTVATPFRDPFVMADPTLPGRWLMVYATALPAAPASMIVGLASSAGDFSAWQDEGSLGITDPSITFSDLAESPHLIYHDGLWYLFFTTNSGQPISFATTPDLFAPTGSWTYRGRLSQMLGYSTAGWIASEYFRDGLIEYFPFVNGDRIEINRLTWLPGDQFSLSQPEIFHVMRMTWLRDSVLVGEPDTLRIESRWAAGRSITLEAFWVDSVGVLHAVPNAALGIPATIALSGDLHEFPWTSVEPPDSLGAPARPELLVRLTDQTASANLLRVVPRLPIDPVPGPDPGPAPPPGDDIPPSEPPVREMGSFWDPEPVLRALGASVLGARPALLVELSEEQPARVDLYDLQGRHVRTLADRRLPAGASVLTWDGRDAAGRALSRGLYFARLTTPTTLRVAKLLLR